jgi:hypothetical protein
MSLRAKILSSLRECSGLKNRLKNAPVICIKKSLAPLGAGLTFMLLNENQLRNETGFFRFVIQPFIVCITPNFTSHVIAK